MLHDTSLFPEELIYLGRNINLVRSINKKCGSLVNRVNVMAKYSIKGLSERDYYQKLNLFLF